METKTTTTAADELSTFIFALWFIKIVHNLNKIYLAHTTKMPKDKGNIPRSFPIQNTFPFGIRIMLIFIMLNRCEWLSGYKSAFGWMNENVSLITLLKSNSVPMQSAWRTFLCWNEMRVRGETFRNHIESAKYPFFVHSQNGINISEIKDKTCPGRHSKIFMQQWNTQRHNAQNETTKFLTSKQMMKKKPEPMPFDGIPISLSHWIITDDDNTRRVVDVNPNIFGQRKQINSGVRRKHLEIFLIWSARRRRWWIF